MTQLILDVGGLDVQLPETSHDKYCADLSPLYTEVEMVSGRLVRELRGSVWMVGYQYDYFKQEMKDRVMAVCRKGRLAPITCGFLPPSSDYALSYARFWITAYTPPKFAWSKKAGVASVPLWHGFSLSLREVKPSD